MDIIALLFLAAAIILGFYKKLNVGFIAMGLSMILGRIGGISDSEIIAAFSTSTFVSIMGITFWFAVINQSGVVELLCKKAIAKVGNAQWIIPFFTMVLGFLVSYVGPGAVPAVLVCIFSIPLAMEVGVNPMLYALPAFAGLCAGRVSPFTPEGAWTAQLGTEQGYTNLVNYITVCSSIIAVVCTLVVFVVYKGWRHTKKTFVGSELPKLNRDQWICLISMIAMVVMVVVFDVNTALACLLIGVILLVLGIGKEKETIRTMPWGTMVLVGGVGMLMVVVDKMGGITLLSNLLSKIMVPQTAAAVMGVTAGVMSWFSSSFGVVMPTLMPTVPDIVENLNGAISGAPLLAAIVYGASIAGISPFSSGGSMCISAMSVDPRFDETQTNKCFFQFFGWAVAFLVIMALLGIVGVFNLVAGIML